MAFVATAVVKVLSAARAVVASSAIAVFNVLCKLVIVPLISLSAALNAVSISLKVSKSAADRFNIPSILDFSVFKLPVNTCSAA